MKNILLLYYVFYIYYTLYFQKKHQKTQVLINLNSKINAMTPVYAAKLSFKV